MLTKFFLGINWVDVALAAVLFRVIFVSVQSGFISEVFKFFAIIVAAFVSLHWYVYLAAMIHDKTSLSMAVWEGIIFVLLNVLVLLVFWFIRMGIMMLFKAETTHQGFDKYAAGFLGAGRAIFLGSLTIFALLLTHHEYIQRQALSSLGYKMVAKAVPNTYSFLYHRLVSKLFEGEKFNEDVFAVVANHGAHPK